MKRLWRSTGSAKKRQFRKPKAVSDYLRTLSKEARTLFLCRYYFADSLRDAAACCHMSESRAKSMLFRARNGLKAYLEKEGFEV